MKYVMLTLLIVAGVLGAIARHEYADAKAANEKAHASQEHAKIAERALSSANQQAQLLREASLARQQELNRLRKQAEAQQKALDEALKANPDWARTPIPDGVLDALTGAQAGAGEARPRVDGGDARARTDRPR